jgi:eukaryotic-like serine/threonine-protein kinase
MSEASRQMARQIFTEVADLPKSAQDAALLTACGDDPEVLAEVRSLIRAGRKPSASLVAATLISEPTNVVAAPKPVAVPEFSPDSNEHALVEEKPGSNIGPYKLLDRIGEGGFGSVFMAEQERPVKRQVALKIIKLGMDTKQVVGRFEQERQALALMDHPNIAKVFDAGATSTGRPYFVMELCRGDPITDYCDRKNLAIAERLGLFIHVCQAVQHAHQKGLIHRDIKPSNILVSCEEGRHSLKVIDFGIAKATASKLSDATVFTEQAQMIGTPQYMSPEQAEGSLDIDTRTDVYALGVLLYELLIGVTPFDAKDLRAAGFGELQRIIREIEPPKPSTRLSQRHETIAGIAAQRQIEPLKLGTLIRGELDWICMKAMEKDRQRRYETANGLGMDIQRYLDGDAVHAAPPSRTYLVRKFVRRNRGPVIAAAVVAFVLVGGLIGTSYGLRQAIQAREAEAAAKLTAQSQAERAVRAEAQTRQRAAELTLVSDFQAGMLAQIDPTKAGEALTADVTANFAAALAKANIPENERPAQLNAFATQWNKVNATDAARALIDQTILKPAIKTIDERFKDQPLVDAQLRQVLADRYLDLGLYDSAQPLVTRALATRRRILGEGNPDTLVSINNMGILLQRQGKSTEAEPYYREAMETRRRVLGNEHPDTLQSIGWLGYLLDEQGRFSEAEPLLRETLQTSRRVLGEEHPTTLDGIAAMGSRLVKQGKLAEAEPLTREALEKRRRVLGEEHRDTVVSLSNLGDLLSVQRKYAEAEPFLREGLEKSRRVLGEAHPYTLTLGNSLGKALQAQGKLAEAEPYIRNALEKRRRVLGEDHPETLNSINNMGGVLREEGRLAEAEPYYREALQKVRRISGEQSREILMAINNLGVLLRNEGKLSEAEPYYLEALEKSRRVLGEEHPDTLKALNNMGALLWSQEKYAQAEPYTREAMEKRRGVLGEEHQETLISISNMGGLLRDQGRLSEALPYYREAFEKSRRVLGEEHSYTLIFGTAVGGVLAAQQQWTHAEALLAPAEIKVRKAFPGGNAYRLAALLTDLGTARAALAKDTAAFSAAEANLLEARAIYTKVPGPSPKGMRTCVRAIADFYERWDKAEPGKGYDVKAAEWEAKLERPANSSKPSG